MTTLTDILTAGPGRAAMAAHLASLCDRPVAECYYFGYSSHGGHALHGPAPTVCSSRGRAVLAGAFNCGDIDGLLCWTLAGQPEGRARLTHGRGWSAVAFWDRSRDTRPNSNTAFIVRGTLTFDQVVRAAQYHWPDVWRRFSFPIVQVHDQGLP